MPLGDPEEIDAILTSYKMGLEEGERQTVEKIVAWLRGDNGFDTEDGLLIADAIERGDHKDI